MMLKLDHSDILVWIILDHGIASVNMWRIDLLHHMITVQTATIHQLITMLSTLKNVQFPGHNHLLTTHADDPTL